VKKVLPSVLCIGILFFLCTPAAASLLVRDIDATGTPAKSGDLTAYNSAYWDGDDQNSEAGFALLPGAKDGEGGVLIWLKALLGQAPTYCDPDTTPWLIREIEAPNAFFGLGPDDKQISVNPGFEWQYAVVKFSGLFIAFENDNNFLLTTPEFKKGISNIRFYGVPEPATMLLLGFGLIGLAAFGRKRFF
jgi:hypothetical protein